MYMYLNAFYIKPCVKNNDDKKLCRPKVLHQNFNAFNLLLLFIYIRNFLFARVSYLMHTTTISHLPS